jgi:hypothetical protein
LQYLKLPGGNNPAFALGAFINLSDGSPHDEEGQYDAEGFEQNTSAQWFLMQYLQISILDEIHLCRLGFLLPIGQPRIHSGLEKYADTL